MHRSVIISALLGMVLGAVHVSAQSEDKPAKEPKSTTSDDILNDLLKDDLGLDIPAKTGDKQDTLPDGPLKLAEEFPEGDDNPLSRVGRGMRKSQSRLLREQDAGNETQEVQKQIVADLDALLKLKRQQKKEKKPSDSKKPNNAPRDTPVPKRPDQGKRDPDNKPATDSNAEAGKGDPKKAEEPLPFGMAADVWGHLKERERQILIQAARMEYLDEYNQMIKDYFSTLAKSRR